MTNEDSPWPTSGVQTVEDIPRDPGWYLDQNDRALHLDDLGIWYFPVETQRYHPDDGALWPWLGLNLRPMVPVVDRAVIERFVRSNPPRELLWDDEGTKQYIIDGIMALMQGRTPKSGRSGESSEGVPQGRCDALAPGRRACRCELLLGHAGEHETHDWEAIRAGEPLVPHLVYWQDLPSSGHAP